MCQTPTWLIISFPDQNLSRLYYLQNKFQILYHDISRPSFPVPKLSPILIFYCKFSTCQSVILTWSPNILHCPCSHCPAPSSPPPAPSSHWNSTGLSRCLESNPPIIFPDSWADFSQMLEISSNSGSQSNFCCCCFSKFILVHGLLYLLSYIFGVSHHLYWGIIETLKLYIFKVYNMMIW